MNNRILKLGFLLIVLAFMVFRLGILSAGFRDSMHDAPLKPPGLEATTTTHFRTKYIKQHSCNNGEIYVSSLGFTQGRRAGMANFKNLSNEGCDIAIPFLYQIHQERWLTLDFSKVPEGPCDLSCLLVAADTKTPRLRIAIVKTDTVVNGVKTSYIDLQGYRVE